MKVAVVGVGSIGVRHLKNLATLGVEHLVAIDKVGTREIADRLENQLGPNVKSLQYVTADYYDSDLTTLGGKDTCDAWLICTPWNKHVLPAMAVMSEGMAVFVEKPLAHDVESALVLTERSEKRHCVSMVGCNMRFHPDVSRFMGETHDVTVWTYSGNMSEWPATSYGPWPFECIHEFDLALHRHGPAQVTDMQATAAGGRVELLHASGAHSVVSIRIDDTDGKRGAWTSPTVGWHGWNMDQDHVDAMYLDEMAHFLDCAKTGKQTCAPFRQGLEAVRVVSQVVVA